MDIGSQIKERRQRLGWSQDELAQKLYVSRVTVSHWETGKTLPDVQSMLLLANLFDTTIDDLVRGSVDEMKEIVGQNEQRTKRFALALGTVEVTVIAMLALAATVGRDYLELVLRLLLAVLVLASSLIALAARRDEGGKKARSAAELLGAASGDPAKAARESASANVMKLVLQIFAGLVVGIGVLVVVGLLFDREAFITSAVVAGCVAVFAVSYALGRYTRPAWTAAVLPVLWVGGAIALAAAVGALSSPKTWFAVIGGAVTLSVFWVDGRRRRARGGNAPAEQ